jgi:hypothetical protein
MHTHRFSGSGKLRRGASALVAAALPLGALAGGGTASAAAHPDRAGAPHATAAGVITTVAGGVGGPAAATRVALNFPCGVSYGAGHLYIADTWSVRQVDPATGWLTTPAGTGLGSPFSNGGPATRTNLLGACSATVDHHGNVVVSESGHHRVRVVAAATGTFYGQAMTAGHYYTVAGNGRKGFAGDGGPARNARLSPSRATVDAAGNLVIADAGNDRIRVVAAGTGTFYGRAMTPGDIYTVAGDGTAGFSGDGGPATAATLNNPQGVTVDAAGNVVIADAGNDRIRVVAATTGTFYGVAMTAGHIYTVAGNGTEAFSGDGGPATAAALDLPAGTAVDGAGNLLIDDFDNYRIRVVAAQTGAFYGRAMTAGHIYTIAGNGTPAFSGDGGPATAAALDVPLAVAVDGSGNVAIAETYDFRVRVVAASTGTFYGKAMTAGDIYTVAGNGDNRFSGDSGLATRAELSAPNGVAVGVAGNLVICDEASNRIQVTAARTGTFYGKAMTAGHMYTVAGDGRNGFSGDGGPAASAELSNPGAVTVDAAGNLVIADTENSRIRVVAGSTGTFYGKAMTDGDIYTVAGNGTIGFFGDGGPATSAGLRIPQGVTVDVAGNLVIADTENNRIRVVAAHTGTIYGKAMTAGDIYTVAGDGDGSFSGDGGPATSAALDWPSAATVDAAGNLVISDSVNARVRVVAESTGTFYGRAMTAGDIYTIAGGGTAGLGDGGPAISATLTDPGDVLVDGAGNLLISDTGDNRVRVVAARTGTFYGQAVTTGDIYTVAGNGTSGFSGDGGPATTGELSLSLSGPSEGLAVDAAGNLLISDGGNSRVRMVTG